MAEKFFNEKAGAARVKHGVLHRYIRLFAQKTGSTSHGKTVCYVDGYSGPGIYADDEAGSPMIAADVHDIISDIRTVKFFFVEKEPKNVERLEQVLAERGIAAVVHTGTAEEHLPSVLDQCGNLPLLAFIDPFGLSVGFDTMKALAARKAPTDIIVNVSLSGLRRQAGHLTGKHAARETLVANVDRMMGGDWWREIWTEQRDGHALCEAYAKRCATLRDTSIFYPIRDTIDGAAKYYLMLISSNRDGIWKFSEFVSKSYDELYEQECAETAQADLFGDREDNAKRLFQERRQQVVEQLTRNLRRQLVAEESFTAWGRMNELLAGLPWGIRDTHLRAALKALKAEGLTSTDPKGVKVLYDLPIVRSGRLAP